MESNPGNVMLAVKKADIISQLQADLLRLQGFKKPAGSPVDLGLGPVARVFPHGSFPLGVVHEFLSSQKEGNVATCGFLAGILSRLMGRKGTALWVSASRTLYPPALKNFGIDPHRVIFTDLKNERQVLWAVEEALKCKALTAVIGEIKDLSFPVSRRLQLAVETSGVTAFVIRSTTSANTTACMSRWKITPLPSESIDDLPGIGFPRWRVELLRVKNGKTGTWRMKWVNGKFETIDDAPIHLDELQRKVG